MDNSQKIPQDAVIRIDQNFVREPVPQTFTGLDVEKVIVDAMSDSKGNSQWINTTRKGGVSCEMLSPGGQWVKGYLKITMTFTPYDETSTG